MSHFCVLVIGDNPEELLAPFQENNMGDCPKGLLEFNDVEDSSRKKFETESSFIEGVEIPHTKRFKSFEVFMKEWFGYELDPEKKRYGYWENPNAKWDWYSLGGRYKGRLILKKGKTGTSGRPGVFGDDLGGVDQAKIGDIDFEEMRRTRIAEAEELWTSYLSEKETSKIAMFQYGVDPGDTRQSYVERNSKFSAFAVIKDGKWYERGEMGWWGIVKDEKSKCKWDEEFSALIEGLPPDTLISIYDCHI